MSVINAVSSIVDGLKVEENFFTTTTLKLVYTKPKEAGGIGRFKAVTHDDAKTLTKKETTDLSEMEAAIVKVVGSDPAARMQVTEAIDQRIHLLRKRTAKSIWTTNCGDKVKQEKMLDAIENLESIKEALNGEKKVPKDKGKKKEPIANKGEEVYTNNNNVDNDVPPPPPMNGNDGFPPPPPPPGGIAGPPGPPPPPAKSKMHRDLTDEPLSTFAEEAENPRPTIKAEHDLNKPTEISKEDKAAYVAAMEKYGAGLKVMYEKWEKQFNELKKAKEELAEVLIQLEGKSAKMEGMVRNIEGLKEAKKAGKSYDLKTTGSKAAPVTFITDEEYKRLEREYKLLTSAERKVLEKKDAIMTEDRTLTKQIMRFEAALPQRRAEVDALKQDIAARKEKIAKMEAEINIQVKENRTAKTAKRSTQPYVDMEPMVTNRKAVLDNVDKAILILTGKKKGAVEPAPKPADEGESAAVNKLLNDPTLQKAAGQTNNQNAKVQLKAGTEEFFANLE